MTGMDDELTLAADGHRRRVLLAVDTFGVTWTPASGARNASRYVVLAPADGYARCGGQGGLGAAADSLASSRLKTCRRETTTIFVATFIDDEFYVLR